MRPLHGIVALYVILLYFTFYFQEWMCFQYIHGCKSGSNMISFE
jgi:hypothetical protein